MYRSLIMISSLVATVTLAETQPTPRPEPDINGMLTGKKPCDEDKNKKDPAKAETQPQAEAAAPAPKVDPASVNFAAPADQKPKPAGAPKSLGAMPGPMENCK